MVNSSVLKSSFCVFLLAVSSGCEAFTPIEVDTPETFLKRHPGLTVTLAAITALGYAATPTEPVDGTHDCSMDMLANDPVTWIRNVFGWLKKDGKWKENKHKELVFDPGYEGAGLVNVAAKTGKIMVICASLAYLLKTIEPGMKQLELLGWVKFNK